MPLRAARERRPGEWSAARGELDAARLQELRVLDVNPDLRMVVINAGKLHGLKPGMAFSVVRKGKGIARVRAIDVRDEITGAAMEETNRRTYPAKGDRLLIAPAEGP